MSPDQLGFFGSSIPPDLPVGFKYSSDVITPAEEDRLIEAIRKLPFREFEFHGYVGKRRVVSFGWRYDFTERALRPASDIPEFLSPARRSAANCAGLGADALRQILVTAYDVGAGIGWHRDKAVFGDVVGISLLAPCTFRLPRQVGNHCERASLIVEPRSGYLLSGMARTEWEHSIPAVDSLRYSVTFRTLR